MPRKEPKLVPFLQKALEKNVQNKNGNLRPRYRNLVYVDATKKVFNLYFPHKKETLNRRDELIFKDWYAETGRHYNFYKDYSVARQGMTQALRRSDYVNMKLDNNVLTVWILTKEEVKEKKRLQKIKSEQKKQEKDALSDTSYDSGFNSPESCMDDEDNNADILQGIEHDHAYGFNPPIRVSLERSNFHYIEQNDKIPDTSGAFKPSGLDQSFDINQIIDTYGLFKPFSLDSSEIESNAMDGCWDHDLSDIPANSEKDYILDDLFKIPNEQFIGSGFQKLQLASKVPALIDAKANTVKLYVCKHCEVIEGVVILMCQLLEHMDTDIADASDNIRVICKETVQAKISNCYVKDIFPVNDDYVIVFERSFTTD